MITTGGHTWPDEVRPVSPQAQRKLESEERNQCWDRCDSTQLAPLISALLRNLQIRINSPQGEICVRMQSAQNGRSFASHGPVDSTQVELGDVLARRCAQRQNQTADWAKSPKKPARPTCSLILSLASTPAPHRLATLARQDRPCGAPHPTKCTRQSLISKGKTPWGRVRL